MKAGIFTCFDTIKSAAAGKCRSNIFFPFILNSVIIWDQNDLDFFNKIKCYNKGWNICLNKAIQRVQQGTPLPGSSLTNYCKVNNSCTPHQRPERGVRGSKVWCSISCTPVYSQSESRKLESTRTMGNITAFYPLRLYGWQAGLFCVKYPGWYTGYDFNLYFRNPVFCIELRLRYPDLYMNTK